MPPADSVKAEMLNFFLSYPCIPRTWWLCQALLHHLLTFQAIHVQSHAEKALLFISGKWPIRPHFSKWPISENYCLGSEMMPLTAILHRRPGSGPGPAPPKSTTNAGWWEPGPCFLSAELQSCFVGLTREIISFPSSEAAHWTQFLSVEYLRAPHVSFH